MSMRFALLAAISLVPGACAVRSHSPTTAITWSGPMAPRTPGESSQAPGSGLVRVPPPPVVTAAKPEPSQPAREPGFQALFPHIRVDLAAGVIEFDGIVPIDAHDPETPHDFLEVMVCTSDTKEHESLVMTRASAAHVHAALLLIGLQPGVPGTWEWDGTNVRAIPPRGDEVEVQFITRDDAGVETVSRPHEWIISVNGRTRFTELSDTQFLFAGSMFRRIGDQDSYSADADGTLVGLCTFGSETIALSRVIHHESSVDEPEWIADAARVPVYETPVTVRLRAGSPGARAAAPTGAPTGAQP